MKALLVAILGGISNVVRGGSHGHIRRKIENWVGIEHDIAGQIIGKLKWYQWIVNRLLDGDVLNAIAFTLTLHFMFAVSWAHAVRGAVGMFIGQAPGWGDYIGSMGGYYGNWRNEHLSESWFIDPIIKPLKKWPKAWGWAGMSIRGMFWSFCIALAFADWTEWVPKDIDPGMALCGGAMAPIYWVATSIHQKLTDHIAAPWWPNEIAFGTYLWLAVYFFYS